MHEAQMYDDNCFLTLTYDDEYLPDDWSVRPHIMQKFMKDLRKQHGKNIRFFLCGEYGDANYRPHYHLLLFNFDFKDKYTWEEKHGNLLYRSSSLERLWPFGFSTIGCLTMQSASYVARYILKKVTGEVADDYYTWIDPRTGEIHQKNPEFVNMSRGGRTGQGGIGESWLKKYAYTDAWNHDFVVLDGKRYPVPRFYQKKLEEMDNKKYIKNRAARKQSANKHPENNTPQRRKVRETVLKAKTNRFQRNVTG